MNSLSAKHCVPCEAGTPPLTPEQIAAYLPQISSAWKVIDKKKLQRTFRCKNFDAVMVFVNKIAETASAEGHHPDLCLFYNKVTVELWTHAIGGLSENDFILASKIEKLKTQ